VDGLEGIRRENGHVRIGARTRHRDVESATDLRGTLDTATKSLRGEMTLRYTNNSPDTLRFVWFQVEQNAFQNGSLNS